MSDEALRDEFSAQAMASLLQSAKYMPAGPDPSERTGAIAHLAITAYEIADAMLEARKKN